MKKIEFLKNHGYFASGQGAAMPAVVAERLIADGVAKEIVQNPEIPADRKTALSKMVKKGKAKS